MVQCLQPEHYLLGEYCLFVKKHTKRCEKYIWWHLKCHIRKSTGKDKRGWKVEPVIWFYYVLSTRTMITMEKWLADSAPILNGISIKETWSVTKKSYCPTESLIKFKSVLYSIGLFLSWKTSVKWKYSSFYFWRGSFSILRQNFAWFRHCFERISGFNDHNVFFAITDFN